MTGLAATVPPPPAGPPPAELLAAHRPAGVVVAPPPKAGVLAAPPAGVLAAPPPAGVLADVESRTEPSVPLSCHACNLPLYWYTDGWWQRMPEQIDVWDDPTRLFCKLWYIMCCGCGVQDGPPMKEIAMWSYCRVNGWQRMRGIGAAPPALYAACRDS